MTDAIVVGAGLFGATIARTLRTAGMDTLVFDDKRPLRASLPSGNVMKPSWFSGLGKEVYEPSLALLERIYGIQDIEFTIWPSKIKGTAHWVPGDDILDIECREETVLDVKKGLVVTGDETYEAPLVIVAAGIWSREFMKIPNFVGKQGVSFLWPGQIKKNFIRPWAPYKQSVAFNCGPNKVWAGDGTAIIPANWTEERQQKSLKRMAGYVKKPQKAATQIVGIRPYVPGAKPCLLEKRKKGLWLATGGAKNGMVAAGWVAHQILKAEG